MQRRTFVKLATISGAAALLRPATALRRESPVPEDPIAAVPIPAVPILDTHIHLFDPTRPGGVPWPDKTDAVLYKLASPERYATIAKPFGVVGAIAIEASPLATDNDWLLRVAAEHPIIVGAIGDLIPGAPTYLADLDRLHANPLFLGFRYGNLWTRNLLVDMVSPGFMDGLRALSQAGLVLECANPNADLIEAAARIADRAPQLRIVIDHLPHATLPPEKQTLDAYWKNLHHLAQNPNVFVKLSEIPVLVDGKLQTSVGYYQDALDAIWNTFGEDHILFGSDWPNSDHVASFADTLKLVRSYISPKGMNVSEKFFWTNSLAAYKWKKRTPDQPSL